MESTSIYAALAAVQSELKAPKGQMNTFGGYRYCSCEDILEAVKPILKAHDLLLTLSDEPKVLEGWHYIEATAKLESLDDRRQWQLADPEISGQAGQQPHCL